MAKTAVKPEEKAVVPTTPNQLADNQDWGEYAGQGQDQVDNQDVAIPRLKLAQAMSPEVKDLKICEEGDLFHSITKEVICKKGDMIEIVPIAQAKEYILWRDRKSGGGIMARAKRVLDGGRIRYKWDKPNTKFDDKVNGQTKVEYVTKVYIDEDGLGAWGSQLPGNAESPPAATEHFNWLFAIPSRGYELVAVTFSRTSAIKAKELGAMIKMGSAPLFARRFNLGSYMENKNNNTYANYGFRPAGFLTKDGPEFKMTKQLFDMFANKSFTVDMEGQDQEESHTQGSGTGQKPGEPF